MMHMAADFEVEGITGDEKSLPDYVPEVWIRPYDGGFHVIAEWVPMRSDQLRREMDLSTEQLREIAGVIKSYLCGQSEAPSVSEGGRD